MVEINNKTRSKINLVLVKKVVKSFLKYYNKKIKLAITPSARNRRANVNNVNNVEVSIAFVGDKVIRNLNKTYRKIDKATDVLAFPEVTVDASSGDDNSALGNGTGYLGEIIINFAQVKRQARKFNHSVNDELIFILIHGLLHLLGYDDKTEKGRKEMEKLGKRFIKKLSIK